MTVTCITPGFLMRYKCAWMFPHDAAHFRGEHRDKVDPECDQCATGTAHPPPLDLELLGRLVP